MNSILFYSTLGPRASRMRIAPSKMLPMGSVESNIFRLLDRECGSHLDIAAGDQENLQHRRAGPAMPR